MQTDYGSSVLSQWAAAEWLESGDYERHLKEVRTALRERRDLSVRALGEWFKEIADWRVPSGGFYIWLRLKHPVSMRLLFEQALGEKILLNPGNVYDQTAAQHLRLSYAYAGKADMERALFRLSHKIKELS